MDAAIHKQIIKDVNLSYDRLTKAATNSDRHWNDWLEALELSGTDWMAEACFNRMRVSMQGMANNIDPFAIRQKPMSEYYFEEYSDKLNDIKDL
jgi:hypothetical protein|tara:strand:- start:1251 stop:1532 length:282 start_codon:yes stop_codon:yes gene_type:complete